MPLFLEIDEGGIFWCGGFYIAVWSKNWCGRWFIVFILLIWQFKEAVRQMMEGLRPKCLLYHNHITLPSLGIESNILKNFLIKTDMKFLSTVTRWSFSFESLLSFLWIRLKNFLYLGKDLNKASLLPCEQQCIISKWPDKNEKELYLTCKIMGFVNCWFINSVTLFCWYLYLPKLLVEETLIAIYF